MSTKHGRRIGILTGGGDAPGLNGIIESVVRALSRQGCELIGIEDGFEGVFAGRTRPLTIGDVQGAHALAGTLLGASNKSATKGREALFLAAFSNLNLDGLIAVGGDGTFAGLREILTGAETAIPLIGVPKTIDNDLAGTDITFGYDTACAVVAEATDALRATAQAHRRVIVVETMGRTAGWIALGGGLASYADAILIPERPFDRRKLLESLAGQKVQERRAVMMVVSEGSFAAGEKPSVAFHVSESPQTERYGGFAERLARWIEKESGWEARHVVLGHLQRARHPTTTDRFLTLAMGGEVARMVADNAWGSAVVYRHGQVGRAPIGDLMKPARLVSPDHRWVKWAQDLGIFI